MSLLSKLAIGTVAVLGAYALKGKGRVATEATAGKPPTRRGSKPRALTAKSATAAGRTTERAGTRKTKTRKRPDRRSPAKRAPATTA
jgi:hypothetical protein